jgi:DNA-binding transcriptional LysR family regulator
VDWDDLRYFLALARLASVRAAGAELGVSHTTVARRVEALEARLGTRLFDRHRDGYALTEAGARMVPAAERVEDEIHALARDLAGRDRRLVGPVHVTCGDEYVADQILRDLRPWCEANPDVDLGLTVDGRPYNLAKGEADLAVRALPRDGSPPEYLVGHRIAPIVVANYVARAHAGRLDPTARGTRWLGFSDPRGVTELLRAGSYPLLPTWGAFSSLPLMVRATVEGLGLALLPTYVGDAEPALERLPEADVRHVADLWLLNHPDLRDTARVVGARTVVRAGFVRRRALYEGRCTDAPVGTDGAPEGARHPGVEGGGGSP